MFNLAHFLKPLIDQGFGTRRFHIFRIFRNCTFGKSRFWHNGTFGIFRFFQCAILLESVFRQQVCVQKKIELFRLFSYLSAARPQASPPEWVLFLSGHGTQSGNDRNTVWDLFLGRVFCCKLVPSMCGIRHKHAVKD